MLLVVIVRLILRSMVRMELRVYIITCHIVLPRTIESIEVALQCQKEIAINEKINRKVQF